MAETLTENEQAAWRPAASLAVQVTAVEPGANSAPEAGWHVTETGAVPPVVDGAV